MSSRRPGIYQSVWEAAAMIGIVLAFWFALAAVFVLACRWAHPGAEPRAPDVEIEAVTAER